MSHKTLLTVFLLITIIVSPICGYPLQNSSPQLKSINISALYSSSVTLEKDAKSSNQTVYNVTLENSICGEEFEVVVGICDIMQVYPILRDFAAIPHLSPSGFAILFLMNDGASWSSVHIHYIATSRQDIRVGQFMADGRQLKSASGDSKYSNQTLSLVYNFGKRKWGGETPYAFLYAYLSGIACNDRFMQITISSAYVNIIQTNIYIGLTTSSKSPISSLYISYIMFTDINSPITISLLNDPFQAQQTSFATHPQNQFISIYSINRKDISIFFQSSSSYSLNVVVSGSKRMLTNILSSTSLELFSNTFTLQGFTISSKEYSHGPILVNNPVRVSSNIIFLTDSKV